MKFCIKFDILLLFDKTLQQIHLELNINSLKTKELLRTMKIFLPLVLKALLIFSRPDSRVGVCLNSYKTSLPKVSSRFYKLLFHYVFSFSNKTSKNDSSLDLAMNSWPFFVQRCHKHTGHITDVWAWIVKAPFSMESEAQL